MRIQLTAECHWCWSPQSFLSHSSFWLPFSFLPTFNVFGFTASCLSVLPKGKHPRFPEQSKGTMWSHEGWALPWGLVWAVLPPLPLPSLAHLNIHRGSLPNPFSVECCTVVSVPASRLARLSPPPPHSIFPVVNSFHCRCPSSHMMALGDLGGILFLWPCSVSSWGQLNLNPPEQASVTFSNVITVLPKGKSSFVCPKPGSCYFPMISCHSCLGWQGVGHLHHLLLATDGFLSISPMLILFQTCLTSSLQRSHYSPLVFLVARFVPAAVMLALPPRQLPWGGEKGCLADCEFNMS